MDDCIMTDAQRDKKSKELAEKEIRVLRDGLATIAFEEILKGYLKTHDSCIHQVGMVSVAECSYELANKMIKERKKNYDDKN